MTEGPIKDYTGIITARQGAVTGNPPESVGDASTITYDAVVTNSRDAIHLLAHTPKRRIAKGAKILVAEVNDPCRIIGVPGLTGYTWYLHVYEGIPFVEACP